ncbi:MAG: riboflavin synthase [Candidatus Melainabacteria bacterium]|nr:riboflavin synthase [Candidatus Melainabacteria bacterium]
MFSGIVEEIGTVLKIESRSGIQELMVSCSKVLNDLEAGDSVAIDGCCQTITEIAKSSFKVQAMHETLQKTNFQKLKEGSRVNLEAPLKAGDKISGHFVSGHIDGTGKIIDTSSFDENKIVQVQFSNELCNYIAPKGSITVNGVSLTVIDLKNKHFTFTLIPYTRDNTNLGLIKIGDLVNLEIDLISRYLVNYFENKKLEVKC